ncbi:MAG: hypothetical protein EHM43_12545 [Ignavibacteriae bacterium]|nr:MAG: hypothetical protein EHM43_12545 [Ignavibacteriota bacterium]
MTTTQQPLTTTRTSEMIEPWLSEHLDTHERDDYQATNRYWFVSGSDKFGSHSSVNIEEYRLSAGSTMRCTALHVSEATGIRAQPPDNGKTALVVNVDGGTASVFLPFTTEQIIAALRAEQANG